MGNWQSKRDRLEQVEMMLQQTRDGITIYDIAAHMGCDESTAHRDLKELKNLHDEDLEEVTRGHYRLNPQAVLHNVRLYPSEALSIYLALRRFIRQTSRAPQFMVAAVQKVAQVLQRNDLKEVIVRSTAALQLERPVSPEYTAIWENLLRGWMEGIVVRIRYQKAQSTTTEEYEIEPYLFEPAILSRGTYLIAWAHNRDALRTFRIERIHRATLTTQGFEHRSLNPDDLLKHAWGIWYGENTTHVELLFTPRAAHWLMETHFHPSEHKEVQQDGSVYWTAQLAGTLEVLSWIRGWGPDVKVLAPDELRQQVAQDLRAAAAQYEE